MKMKDRVFFYFSDKRTVAVCFRRKFAIMGNSQHFDGKFEKGFPDTAQGVENFLCRSMELISVKTVKGFDKRLMGLSI